MPYPFAYRSNMSLLSEEVRPIGKRRIEIRQRVSCPQEEGRFHYLVETWFFLPRSLQINRWSYTPTHYQQSLKNYIRLGVPNRSLESLLEPKCSESGCSEHSEPSMLSVCERNLEKVLEKDTPGNWEAYEDSLKLFCLVFRAALLNRKREVLALADDEERTRAALALTRTAVACLKQYRGIGKRALTARPDGVPVFLFCDEYLAIIVTQVLAELVRRLTPLQSCTSFILASYAAQRAYRRQKYPDSLPSEEGDNEMPVFRWSILKKFVDMPLFLSIQRHPGNTLLAHTLYSLAAAVAMACALTTTILWQDVQSFGTPLFVIAIVAYMLRERIKDAFRGTLFDLFQRWIPDRLLYIRTGHGKKLGRCAESFRFADWDKMPKDVRRLRNRTHFVDILNAFHNEDILYYSKRIDIHRLPDPFFEGKKLLIDISRFDIADFLRHADDVLDEPQGSMEERPVKGEKIYHVDMVRKITHGCGTQLERFRIVLTHAGIRRIDEIEPLGKEAV